MSIKKVVPGVETVKMLKQMRKDRFKKKDLKIPNRQMKGIKTDKKDI